MKKWSVVVTCLLVSSFAYGQIIIDHLCTDITIVPQPWVEQAKADLHIAYGHTSHGSQVTVGMTGLVDFMNGLGGYPEDLYAWNNGGIGGALDLDEEDEAVYWHDLGDDGELDWAVNTVAYLDAPANIDVNVIMWSWCGGVSGNTVEGINT